jgi:endosialidase-like protein
MTGSFNTAIGFGMLHRNTTGSNNTAIGLRAGLNSTTSENNIYLGAGMFGFPGESNHTYVRNVNITSVSGGGAETVTMDLDTGLIGHLSSSRRYKQNIKPMDNTSEAFYRLRPVTFRYKKEIGLSRAYLLLGVPLVVLFQLFIARRPLRNLWVRDATTFRLGLIGIRLAALLILAPGYDLVFVALPKKSWVVASWFLCAMADALEEQRVRSDTHQKWGMYMGLLYRI